MAQLRTTLGRDQVREDWHFCRVNFVNTDGNGFHRVSLTLLAFRATFPISLLLISSVPTAVMLSFKALV